MTVAVSVVVVAGTGWYLWLLWATALGRRALTPQDRYKLLDLVLEACLALLVARILVPWTPLTSWLWVLGVAAMGGGAGLAVWRSRGLPWVAAPAPAQRRRRRVTAPVYAVVLAVLVGAAYAPLF